MKALVIASGGQDSTTCLAWTLSMFKQVEAITFFYGQKHKIEIEQSKKICKCLGVKQTIVDLSFLPDLVDSALTSDGNVNMQHERMKDLPASWVPNRNGLFILLAHAYAQKIGALRLVTGVCQTDFSGYLDCRDEFIKSIEKSLNLGSGANISIVTPLMWLDKIQSWKLAEDLGVLDLVIKESHTCYNGDRKILHPWGYGCSEKIDDQTWEECPACKLRRISYLKFIEQKKIVKQNE